MKTLRLYLLGAMMMMTTLVFSQSKTINTTYPGTDLKLERSIETRPDGSMQIKEKVFHANGQVWLENKIHDNGRIHEFTYYYASGNPFWKGVLIDNKLEGEYVHWYSNGQIAEVIQFENNAENGKAIFYHPNGEQAMRGTYKDGKMIGDWKFFNDNGSAVKKKLWSWLFFDTADLRMQGWIKNYKMEGHWEYTETANADKPYRRQFYLKYAEGELIQ